MAVFLPFTSPSFLSVPAVTSSVSSAAPQAVILSALLASSVLEIITVTAAMVAQVALFEVDGQKDEATIIPMLVLNEKNVLLNDIFGGVSYGNDDPDSGDDDNEGNDDDDDDGSHGDGSDGGDSAGGEGDDGEDDEENSGDGDDGNEEEENEDEEEDEDEDEEENNQDDDADNDRQEAPIGVDSDGEPIWRIGEDPRPTADPSLNARVNKLLTERADSIFQAQCFILIATRPGYECPKMVIFAEHKGVFDGLLHGAPYTNETLKGLSPVLHTAGKATSKALRKLHFIFEEVGDDYIPDVGIELEPLRFFAKCWSEFANTERICVLCEKNKVKRSTLPCSHWFICERCSGNTKPGDPLYPDHCLICGRMITGWDLYF